MPIPQLETLPQWQSFLRTLLVRGYHFKNGISIETAERYADAIFECLGDFVNDEDKIKLIVASKYTTDPETAVEKAGLLRKVFGGGQPVGRRGVVGVHQVRQAQPSAGG